MSGTRLLRRRLVLVAANAVVPSLQVPVHDRDLDQVPVRVRDLDLGFDRILAQDVKTSMRATAARQLQLTPI